MDFTFEWSFDWPTVGLALLMFSIRTIDLSLASLRIVMARRGFRLYATVLGFISPILWVLVVSRVISDLGNPIKLAAYSGGFATGIFVGIIIESKLAVGFVRVTIISRHKGREILKALRRGGYGATSLTARGYKGEVAHIDVIAERKSTQEIQRIAESTDGGCFITVEDTRRVYRGIVPHRDHSK